MRHAMKSTSLFLFIISLFPGISSVYSAQNPFTRPVEFGSQAQSRNGIPSGWELKEWTGRPAITIENDNGTSLLRMFSDKSSFGIGKEVKLSAAEYPFLEWRWKVTQLPEGGDARIKKANDQAAQIYLVFPKFPATVNSRVVGYIWDSTAPEGAHITSPVSPHIKYIVVRSGKEKIGAWIQENRNVYQDYKALFGEEPPVLEKVFLMIDSDNTKSIAECYFGNIRFQKKALAGLPPDSQRQ